MEDQSAVDSILVHQQQWDTPFVLTIDHQGIGTLSFSLSLSGRKKGAGVDIWYTGPEANNRYQFSLHSLGVMQDDPVYPCIVISRPSVWLVIAFRCWNWRTNVTLTCHLPPVRTFRLDWLEEGDRKGTHTHTVTFPHSVGSMKVIN